MQLSTPLILASRSPRRIALLRQIGLTPEVRPCDIPEIVDPAKSPEENARDLALQKATSIARDVPEGITIGADTIVLLNDALLGKPEDPEDAVRMLTLLSGNTHTVITGIALVETPGGRSLTDFETTLVTFRHLPESEIREYVAGGSPMDKAGAYGIQDDYGAVFVTRIEGCYYNVMGLPLARLYQRLTEFAAQSNGRK